MLQCVHLLFKNHIYVIHTFIHCMHTLHIYIHCIHALHACMHYIERTLHTVHICMHIHTVHIFIHTYIHTYIHTSGCEEHDDPQYERRAGRPDLSARYIHRQGVAAH